EFRNGSDASGTGVFEITGSSVSITLGNDPQTHTNYRGQYKQNSLSTLKYAMDASGVSSIDLLLNTSGTADPTVNLGGTLDFDFSALSDTIGDIVLIDQAGVNAITGTFSSFAEGDTVHTFGSGNSYQLTYLYDAGADAQTNDLALLEQVTQVIPEPSAFAIWALGLLGLAWYGRRKRK
ncbi:unnamed protein product, partial [marine sediment metagenome]